MATINETPNNEPELKGDDSSEHQTDHMQPAAAAYEMKISTFLQSAGGSCSIGQIVPACGKPPSGSGKLGKFLQARPELFEMPHGIWNEEAYLNQVRLLRAPHPNGGVQEASNEQNGPPQGGSQQPQNSFVDPQGMRHPQYQQQQPSPQQMQQYQQYQQYQYQQYQQYQHQQQQFQVCHQCFQHQQQLLYERDQLLAAHQYLSSPSEAHQWHMWHQHHLGNVMRFDQRMCELCMGNQWGGPDMPNQWGGMNRNQSHPNGQPHQGPGGGGSQPSHRNPSQHGHGPAETSPPLSSVEVLEAIGYGQENILVAYSSEKANALLAEGFLDRPLIVGFDTESPPRFTAGEMRTPPILVQLATEKQVVLVHLGACGEVPQALIDVIQDPDVIKIGTTVAEDLKDLYRSYPEQLGSFKDHASGWVDFVAVGPLLGCPSFGLKKLAQHFGVNTVKGKKWATSNWKASPLDPGQINYAASDAGLALWILKKMHEKLSLLDLSLMEFTMLLSNTVLVDELASREWPEAMQETITAFKEEQSRREKERINKKANNKRPPKKDKVGGETLGFEAGTEAVADEQ